MSEFINSLLDPQVSLLSKYVLLLELVIWSLFDTSFGSEIDIFIPGKIITSGCILVGLAYNIYILIEILNIMNTVHAPRTKFYEVMNQLDAYMQKKQFPIDLQKRLKFFYKKKFRKFYYQEEEIFNILSGTSRLTFKAKQHLNNDSLQNRFNVKSSSIRDRFLSKKFNSSGIFHKASSAKLPEAARRKIFNQMI